MTSSCEPTGWACGVSATGEADAETEGLAEASGVGEVPGVGEVAIAVGDAWGVATWACAPAMPSATRKMEVRRRFTELVGKG